MLEQSVPAVQQPAVTPPSVAGHDTGNAGLVQVPPSGPPSEAGMELVASGRIETVPPSAFPPVLASAVASLVLTSLVLASPAVASPAVASPALPPTPVLTSLEAGASSVTTVVPAPPSAGWSGVISSRPMKR